MRKPGQCKLQSSGKPGFEVKEREGQSPKQRARGQEEKQLWTAGGLRKRGSDGPQSAGGELAGPARGAVML